MSIRRSIAALVPGFVIGQAAIALGIPISFDDVIISGVIGGGLAGGSAGVSRRRIAVTFLFWLLTLVSSVAVGLGLGLIGCPRRFCAGSAALDPPGRRSSVPRPFSEVSPHDRHRRRRLAHDDRRDRPQEPPGEVAAVTAVTTPTRPPHRSPTGSGSGPSRCTPSGPSW